MCWDLFLQVEWCSAEGLRGILSARLQIPAQTYLNANGSNCYSLSCETELRKWSWNITRTFSSHFSQLSHTANCRRASHSLASLFLELSPEHCGQMWVQNGTWDQKLRGPDCCAALRKLCFLKKNKSSQQQWWWNGSVFLLSWLWTITSQTGQGKLKHRTVTAS